VHGVARDGRSARLVAGEDVDQFPLALGDREVSLEVTRYGNVSIGSRLPALWLEDVRVEDDGLRLIARGAGELVTGAGALRVGLDPADRIDLRWLTTTAAGDGLIEVVVPARFPTTGGDRPLAAGTWGLVARHRGADGSERDVDLRLPRSLVSRFPLELQIGHKTVAFDDLSWQRPAVVVSDDLEVTERGRHHRDRLWAAAVSRGREGAVASALDQVVLVVEAGGRRTGGCPAAVLAELRRRRPDLEVRVAVEDQQVVLPADVTTVRIGGREWHETLASAAFVLADTPLPDHFRRPDGQVCVMTWPGVPIRAVGLDAGRLGPAEDASEEVIRTAARQWTHLVSPNPFATEVLQRAFDLRGSSVEVLEVGHPRHDVLVDDAAVAARRTAVRTGLGIPGDAPLVLFTPTWFDHQRHPGKVLRLVLDVDLERLRAAAGEDAWLLVRSHPEVPDRVGGLTDDARILDVSGHPDLVGLQLAADVAVTHASSLALDAARTGTPLVVHDPPDAPIDEQGPLYVDLRTDVPWPVTTDEAELLDTVRRLRAEGPVTSASTGAILTAHGDVADGRAASAVVDAMLGGRPTA
jgi:CDP-glycerol glycerophosphotransferase